MNNVTRFPGHARGAKPPLPLTSAHHFLMYSIMDLTLDISMLTNHRASFDYRGHVHVLTVDVMPPEHLAAECGGDGSFRTCYRVRLDLPPSQFATPDCLQQLADVITQLEAFLPGGAA